MFSPQVKGLFCGIVAAAAYGMNPLFTLPLYKLGLTAESVLFYRYFLAMLMLLGVMKFQHESFALPWKLVVPALICGVLVALSSLLLFLSYQKMDAGIASTILFVYPVMVAVMMCGIFHEKITFSAVLGVLGALLGVGILYRGGEGGVLSFGGVMLVLGSALSYAIYMVAIKQSALGKLSSVPLTFYIMVFGLPLFLLRTRGGLDLQWIPSWFGLWCIIGLSLFPTVISFLLMTVAIKLIGATKTAILGALEPVTALLVGISLFGEQLTLRSSVGILIILLAVTVVITGCRVKFLENLTRYLPGRR
ncbi:MAG: DMT family transporter [Victivallaceae bacterium]